MTNINRTVMTLDEFTTELEKMFPLVAGELSGLLSDMGLAAKRVNAEVGKAGLVDAGRGGEENGCIGK